MAFDTSAGAITAQMNSRQILPSIIFQKVTLK